MDLDVNFSMQLINLITEVLETYDRCLTLNDISDYDEMLSKLDEYRGMQEFIEKKAMVLKVQAQSYATQMVQLIFAIKNNINVIDTSITKQLPDNIGIISDNFTLPQLFLIKQNGVKYKITNVESVDTMTIQSILNYLRKDKITLEELKKAVIDTGLSIVTWINITVFRFTNLFDEHLTMLSSVDEEEFKDKKFNISAIYTQVDVIITEQTKALIHLHHNMKSYNEFNEQVKKNPLSINETFIATESFIELI